MKSTRSRQITVGRAFLVAWILLVVSVPGTRRSSGAAGRVSSDRPNILFCISDDQSCLMSERARHRGENAGV